jgi:hypothetical protein
VDVRQVTSASYMQRFADASVRSLTAAKRLKELQGAAHTAALRRSHELHVLREPPPPPRRDHGLPPGGPAAPSGPAASGGGGHLPSGHAGSASAANAWAAADAMAAVLAGLEADALPRASGSALGANRKGRKPK